MDKKISLGEFLTKHNASSFGNISFQLLNFKDDLRELLNRDMQLNIMQEYLSANGINISKRHLNKFLNTYLAEEMTEYKMRVKFRRRSKVKTNTILIECLEQIRELELEKYLYMINEAFNNFINDDHLLCTDVSLCYNYKYTNFLRKATKNYFKYNRSIELMLSFILNLFLFSRDQRFIKRKLSSFYNDSSIIYYYYNDKHKSSNAVDAFEDIIVECYKSLRYYIIDEEITDEIIKKDISEYSKQVNSIFNASIFKVEW